MSNACGNESCTTCSGFDELLPENLFFEQNGLWFHYAVRPDDMMNPGVDPVDRSQKKGPYGSRQALLVGFVRYLADLVEDAPPCTLNR
jgi:hypothetical protein